MHVIYRLYGPYILDCLLLCNCTSYPDEVDSLLSRRKESEHDAMRRIKNEFLQSLDGVSVTSIISIVV